MLSKIEVHSPREPSLVLLELTYLELFTSSDRASIAPIQLRNVDGLGPVKANINTTPFGIIDGEYVTGTAIGKRNIILTLGLNPNWVDQSITSLRAMLYQYFMPRSTVKLRFFTDTIGTVEISGYVESLDPNIFTKDPEIQISIICPQPDFVAVDATGMSTAVNSGPVSYDYLGTIPTGFVLKVESASARPAYTGYIYLHDELMYPYNNQVLAVSTATIDTTKYLEVSTLQGSKHVQNVDVSFGIRTSLLRYKSGVWPVIGPGLNNFSVLGASSGQLWTITYFSRFGGI